MKNTTSNVDSGLGMHLESYDNPHLVTKAQVGLGNVEDVKQYSQLNPPPNYIESVCGKKPDEAGNIKLVKGDVGLGKVDNLKQYSEVNQPPYPVTSVNGMKGDVIIEAGAGGDTGALEDTINDHISNTTNPHSVDKDQIGLGNVDNTRDIDKPISNMTQAALDKKLNVCDYNASDVLAKIKTVDGSGSGLDADLLGGKRVSNSANNIPVLNASSQLPIAQIPTGTSSSTVALGSHGHSGYAASYHSHPGSTVSLSTSLSDSSTSSAATPYLTNSLNNRLVATETQLSPGITGTYTLMGAKGSVLVTFRKGVMVQVVHV